MVIIQITFNLNYDNDSDDNRNNNGFHISSLLHRIF